MYSTSSIKTLKLWPYIFSSWYEHGLLKKISVLLVAYGMTVYPLYQTYYQKFYKFLKESAT